MRAAFETAAELLAATGRDLGPASWVAVDGDRVRLFAAATGDPDDVPAFLVLSLAAATLDEVFTVPGATFAMNYGLDDVRFGPSVPVDARVRLAARIADVTVRRGGAVDVALALTIECEGAREPACTARQLARFQFAAEEEPHR